MVKPIDLLEAWAPKREVMKLGVGYRVRVTPPSVTGFSSSTVDLTDDQFERFQSWLKSGGLIQAVLSDLSDDDREILMTGINPEQWEEAFGNDE